MSAVKRDERIDASYWQYVLESHAEPSAVLEACFRAAWRGGGRQAIRDMAGLADLVSDMHALIGWFEEVDV